MKFTCLLIIISLLLFTDILQAQRVKYNFNREWKVLVGDDTTASSVQYNDGGWKKVTLPWAWNEDDAFKKDIADLTTGIAWYRKQFVLSATNKGSKVFIEFEGMRQAGDVYVNGQHVALYENGVMAAGYDISDLVHFGPVPNLIAVRTDNSWDYKEKATGTKFQWIDKNFNANYGGLSKNVFLHVTGKLYQTLPLFSNLGTTGTYIYATDFNIRGKSATIHSESQVKNESGITQSVQFRVNISDMQGKPVIQFAGDKITLKPGEMKVLKAAAQVQNLNFWSWGYGYLYNVQTSLIVNGKAVDIVSTRTGFRKTAFENGMVYLNDRVIQIKGYGQRTSNEWPAIGMSVPAWLSDYSNSLMVAGNANLVRWMHITPWKQDVESCDRVGLMQAMPAGDAEHDVTGRRWEQREAVMRDAIIYNRNNPSIIFYECGNESISEQHMQEMKSIKYQYDPYGGRAIGSREMLDSKVAEYGGEMLYINKSAHIPMWATEYSRDEGLRKYWDDFSPPFHKDGDGPPYRGQPAPTYNRNQESHAVENVIRWYEYWKERPGTGKRVSSGGVNIIFSESNTHHRGAENYRRSGEVDALRILKENYYANMVMWDGWVDTELPRIHIIGHWNYSEEVTKDIYVVSSADKVELFLNGKSLGFGEQSNRFLFTFKNVHTQHGIINAIGYDKKGKQVCKTMNITTGAPAAVRLRSIASPKGWQADGHDLIMVEVDIVDARGFRVPISMDTIHFSLSGPAEWRGGMAQGPDNFILSKDLPVECGVNRVLVRSATIAGNITVTARATGLKSASLQLTTLPTVVTGGLSRKLPGEGLPSYVKRGPTPSTPSFTKSRNAIGVAKTIAGKYTDSAWKSTDDNELTEWNNGGALADAWIEYELEREATISEVTMKLNNFRSRIYPIRITVDGKEIFKGNTERSLGYFTAKCNPVKGKKVKIELLGNSNQQEGSETEVGGQKLDDGVKRDDAKAKGTLSIIEIEFYEAI